MENHVKVLGPKLLDRGGRGRKKKGEGGGELKVCPLVKATKEEIGGYLAKVKHQGLFWGVAKSF